MKLVGTVREFQDLQNKCMVMECDNCILCKVGTCEVYDTMQYMEGLSHIDTELETTLDL